MAAASEALFSGFGSPPVLAATVMMRESLVNSAERFASDAALRCLVVAHLECPDIMPRPFGLARADRRVRRSSGASAGRP